MIVCDICGKEAMGHWERVVTAALQRRPDPKAGETWRAEYGGVTRVRLLHRHWRFRDTWLAQWRSQELLINDQDLISKVEIKPSLLKRLWAKLTAPSKASHFDHYPPV